MAAKKKPAKKAVRKQKPTRPPDVVVDYVQGMSEDKDVPVRRSRRLG